MLILWVSSLYLNDEHVLWVGFPLFNHASFSPRYPTFNMVINPTAPWCTQCRSALPPTLTKKRKLFHLPNPFIHGLQVISPYSTHNPGPSGRERETDRERGKEEKGPYRDRNRETMTQKDTEGETERVRQSEREVAQGGNTDRGKDTERNKKYGDKQQCCEVSGATRKRKHVPFSNGLYQKGGGRPVSDC